MIVLTHFLLSLSPNTLFTHSTPSITLASGVATAVIAIIITHNIISLHILSYCMYCPSHHGTVPTTEVHVQISSYSTWKHAGMQGKVSGFL